jgi:dCMP deaminase
MNSYFEKNKNHIEKIDKPSWCEYFISMAFLASTRSSDAQTKHGCVITDSKNRILGVGYNSFPSNMPDEILPNIRPNKYKWMVHAERNALANCSLRPEDGIAYVTGKPCIECLKAMYQEGINKIVCARGHGTYEHGPEEEEIFNIIVQNGNISIDWISPSFDKTFKKLKQRLAF